MDNGAFGWRGNSNCNHVTVYQNGASTWTQSATFSPGAATTTSNYAPANTNSGMTLCPFASGSATALGFNGYVVGTTSINTTSVSSMTISGNTNNGSGGAFGPTSSGGFLLCKTSGTGAYSSSTTFYSYPYGMAGTNQFYNYPFNYPSPNTVTFDANMATQHNMNIIPNEAFDNVVVWLDFDNIVVWSFFNAHPYNYAVNTTSGVTNSSLVPITPSTTTQNAVNSTVLVGVAATTASAGSTGQVVINGQAVLNSTYPATLSAQGFDFQGQGVLGVRGTIINRNVNLQGNS
jgi:hypothetical protein